MKSIAQHEPQATVEEQPQDYAAPAVNVLETEDGYILEAEMPGVARDGLEVTLEDRELTIVGHYRKETVPGEALFRERPLADYRRTFELEPAIDTANIRATMNQGLLTLTLPKSERVKPRKIVVGE